jgi:hypothetical protein
VSAFPAEAKRMCRRPHIRDDEHQPLPCFACAPAAFDQVKAEPGVLCSGGETFDAFQVLLIASVRPICRYNRKGPVGFEGGDDMGQRGFE